MRLGLGHAAHLLEARDSQHSSGQQAVDAAEERFRIGRVQGQQGLVHRNLGGIGPKPGGDAPECLTGLDRSVLTIPSGRFRAGRHIRRRQIEQDGIAAQYATAAGARFDQQRQHRLAGALLAADPHQIAADRESKPGDEIGQRQSRLFELFSRCQLNLQAIGLVLTERAQAKRGNQRLVQSRIDRDIAQAQRMGTHAGDRQQRGNDTDPSMPHSEFSARHQGRLIEGLNMKPTQRIADIVLKSRLRRGPDWPQRQYSSKVPQARWLRAPRLVSAADSTGSTVQTLVSDRTNADRYACRTSPLRSGGHR